MRDFAELENRLRKLAGQVFEIPEIFVGKKSPVTRSECLSVIAGSYDADGKRVSILAIGPKRMDYKKVIKVFKNLDGKTAARNKK